MISDIFRTSNVSECDKRGRKMNNNPKQGYKLTEMRSDHNT